MICVEDSNGNLVAVKETDLAPEVPVLAPAPQAELLGQPIELENGRTVELPELVKP